MTPVVRVASSALFVLAGCLSLSGDASAQLVVRTEYIDVAKVGGQHRFQVILPASYDERRTYPVLWLLHGYGATDSIWFRRTKLLSHVAHYPLIVVLPDARRSWYVNARMTPNAEYESFILEDLHSAVASRFRIDTLHEAVAGVSMGGYGAAILALRHPRRFKFAGLILPALSIPDSIVSADTTQDEGFGHSIELAFGPVGDVSRRQYDPFHLLLAADVATLPVFYLAVTPTDEYPSFVPVARRWVDVARNRGSRVEYVEVAGPHNMLTADAALPAMLESCWRALSASTSPKGNVRRSR